MKSIFLSSDNITSPIGLTSAENFDNLSRYISGVKRHELKSMSDQPFYASLFTADEFPSVDDQDHTKFEQLLISSVSDALKRTAVDAANKKTILIISTTKGSVSLLENEAVTEDLVKRISLTASAKKVATHFGFVHKPVIVSNACISGLLAMITAMRLIRSGQYDHAVVTGADVISKFVLSGFQSFQAVSNGPCKPFDESRSGINLGEGAATMVLTSDSSLSSGIEILGGSVSNDANHISGPSRTGEELYLAISKAMKEAAVNAKDIGLVSAHGTATLYNDEMEAKAITLANLQEVPVNSLKGYYGHTLGAAGLIESIISIQSMEKGLLIPTLGFERMGVSKPLNVISAPQQAAIKYCLKTASGFGGCNAAVVIKRA